MRAVAWSFRSGWVRSGRLARAIGVVVVLSEVGAASRYLGSRRSDSQPAIDRMQTAAMSGPGMPGSLVRQPTRPVTAVLLPMK